MLGGIFFQTLSDPNSVSLIQLEEHFHGIGADKGFFVLQEFLDFHEAFACLHIPKSYNGGAAYMMIRIPELSSNVRSRFTRP